MVKGKKKGMRKRKRKRKSYEEVNGIFRDENITPPFQPSSVYVSDALDRPDDHSRHL